MFAPAWDRTCTVNSCKTWNSKANFEEQSEKSEFSLYYSITQFSLNPAEKEEHSAWNASDRGSFFISLLEKGPVGKNIVRHPCNSHFNINKGSVQVHFLAQSCQLEEDPPTHSSVLCFFAVLSPMPSVMFVFLDDLFNSLLFSFFRPCERDGILQGKLLEHMARYNIVACKLTFITASLYC